jgi:nitrogen regulatory protein PII 2
MKEVLAIIRMNKVNATKKALLELGINGMNAVKVSGRGKLPLDFINNPVGEEVQGILEDSFSHGGRLIPKRLIDIMVPDQDTAKVVESIINVNQEGKPGDGKIFILPVDDVVRIRTGERGDKAI